jgi:hypothetical protein
MCGIPFERFFRNIVANSWLDAGSVILGVFRDRYDIGSLSSHPRRDGVTIRKSRHSGRMPHYGMKSGVNDHPLPCREGLDFPAAGKSKRTVVTLIVELETGCSASDLYGKNPEFSDRQLSSNDPKTDKKERETV